MKTNALIVGAAALLSAATAVPAQDMVAINIGFPPAVDFMPAYVAKENGCFAEKGIDATMTVIPVSTNIPPALVSGSLQIGGSTPTTLLPAVENGLGLKAIAGSSRVIKGKEGISVVTSPAFNPTIAQDFVGKKVGVPGIFSVADLMFRKWVKDNGVNLDDITFVEVPFPRMMEMMSSGNVDAVVATEPVRSLLVAKGVGQRAPFEYHTQVVEDSLLTFWMATGEWAAANPQVVAGFKECVTAGIDWIHANRAEADVIEQKYINMQTKQDHSWTADVAVSDFAIYAAVALEFGLITTELNLDDVVFAP